MVYRVEDKYRCDLTQMAEIRERLRGQMTPDAHSGTAGYLVRSLYFDDLWDRAVEDTLSGVDDRVKFRLRLYNRDAGLIKLEAKEKRRGLCHKESCTVSRQQAEALIAGERLTPRDDRPPVFNRFLAERAASLLRPTVVVEYEREALVHPAGNVRVTFDRCLTRSGYPGDFLDPQAYLQSPVLGHLHLLEVKYDGLLPGTIREALDSGALSRTAFSKYAICRIGAEKV